MSARNRLRLPLLWRMSLPALAVSLVLLLVGLAAGAYVYRWNAAASDRVYRRVTDQLDAEELLLALRDARNDIVRYGTTGSEKFLQSARLAAEVAQRLADRLAAREQDPDMTASLAVRLAAAGEFIRGAESLTPEQASAARDGVMQRAIDAADALLEANRGAADAAAYQNQLAARRVGMGIAMLGVCGGGAGLLAGLAVARSVVRSIEALGGTVSSLNASLAGHEDRPRRTAELQELLHAMTEVQERTEGMVTELQKSRATAARSDQLAAVGQLAAGIAHELRNPLTAIKLLADSALEQRTPLSDGEVLVVRDEATRMQQMLQTFLDFARPPRLVREEFDLADETRQAVEIVRPRADRVGVAIRFRARRATPLRADKQQLRQVLLNLLINSVDAQPGGGRIDVEVRAHEGEVVVEVEDRGAGIPPEVAGRLFEPFVSSKETGVGLGLAVSQRIVAKHGGAITGENVPAGGARFRVVLPTSSEPAAAPEPIPV